MADPIEPLDPPLVIKDTSFATMLEVLSVIGRYFGVIAASWGAIAAILSKHDLAALIAFFRGEEGAGVIAAGTAIVGIAYAVYKTWLTRRQKVTTYRAAPNTVAIVKK